ncbi:MAG: HAD-IIA family hydrolase [Anaerolineae bacterium]
MLDKLRTIRSFILDMDGVLYRGRLPLPGAPQFIEYLQSQRTPFILLTNNSTQTAAQYVTKLREMGIAVAEESILTSAQATALYLRQIAAPGTRVYVIGEKGLRQAIEENGYLDSDEGAAFVVVGWDRQLTYDKLKRATLAIRNGAQFIGTNPDRTFPSEEGIVPGNGAILAAIQAATDVEPTIIGKPEPTVFRLALERMAAAAKETAVVGDRLETDILGGHRAGLTTILLLSGVCNKEELAGSNLKPDLVFEGVQELHTALREARVSGVAQSE